MKLPPVLTSVDIAKLLGWSTPRARRWLLNTGAGQKRAGRVVTTPTALAAHFPEVLAVLARDVVGDED